MFSVALLLVTAMLSFYTSGRAEAVELGLIAPGAPFTLATVSTAVAQADTIFLVLRAALLCGLAAIALTKLLRLSSVGEGIKAWLHGAEALMPTIVILLLAWSLADVVKNLGTVYYVVEIISAGVPAFLVPSLIFVCCCLISFASGSYGCMFMVMPMAIPIASAVVGAENLSGDSSFLLLCVASVLSGSIFGDHCSPMTDCTVLAALGSGCNIMEHVRTQLPYAMTVAAVTIVFGTLLTALGMSVWLSLALGCAAMAALLLGRFTNSAARRMGVFFTVLMLPTVFLNGALWAQCDSIYVALALLGIYCALDDRPVLSMVLAALSFGFKLQAVFILPALAAALFMGKVKPKHLLWIPAVYFVSILPALIAGRSLADCLNIYTNQVGYYKGLFFNAPTVWRFFGDAQIPALTNMSVYPALGALILFTLYAISAVKSVDDKKLISLFFISALLAAFLLPRMHERYFYMAEVLSIAYFMCNRRKWYVPAVLTAASLSSYMEYFLVYSMSSYEEYAAKTVGIKPVYFAAAILVILAVEGRVLFGGTVRANENLK